MTVLASPDLHGLSTTSSTTTPTESKGKSLLPLGLGLSLEKEQDTTTPLPDPLGALLASSTSTPTEPTDEQIVLWKNLFENYSDKLGISHKSTSAKSATFEIIVMHDKWGDNTELLRQLIRDNTKDAHHFTTLLLNAFDEIKAAIYSEVAVGIAADLYIKFCRYMSKSFIDSTVPTEALYLADRLIPYRTYNAWTAFFSTLATYLAKDTNAYHPTGDDAGWYQVFYYDQMFNVMRKSDFLMGREHAYLYGQNDIRIRIPKLLLNEDGVVERDDPTRAISYARGKGDYQTITKSTGSDVREYLPEVEFIVRYLRGETKGTYRTDLWGVIMAIPEESRRIRHNAILNELVWEVISSPYSHTNVRISEVNRESDTALGVYSIRVATDHIVLNTDAHDEALRVTLGRVFAAYRASEAKDEDED